MKATPPPRAKLLAREQPPEKATAEAEDAVSW